MGTRVHVKPPESPILIGLGANLPSRFGPPRETCESALEALAEFGVSVVRRSRWYRSAPLPPSDQPWFVNGVAAIETAHDPPNLLAALGEVERRYGRVRGGRWSARCLDLDLLDYRGILRGGAEPPELPHPRLHERAFVLLPLAEVAPEWRHPRLERPVGDLIADLPAGQVAEPLP